MIINNFIIHIYTADPHIVFYVHLGKFTSYFYFRGMKWEKMDNIFFFFLIFENLKDLSQ